MRRLRLLVEYDGTDFHGWQRQDNATSIQAELERVMHAMTGETREVRGAGRTDAGVHARGQVAHVDTERDIPVRGFHLGLNKHLPRAIVIRRVEEAPPEFDARHSALAKHYRYSIWNDAARSALRDRYAFHVRRALDHERMAEGARYLVGRHDFAAFRSADCDRTNTVRTLHRVEVRRDAELVTIDVEGDAFLKNMVRILSGTLIAVGQGRLKPEAVALIRDGRDRRVAGITAPPFGLCLERIDYPANEDLAAEHARRAAKSTPEL
jgi:tRNA pseudouridine38-40 synthase